MHPKHATLTMLLLLVLAGCSRPEPIPTPNGARSATPTAPLAVMKQPAGPALPGRIAFSAGGNLWVWEDGQTRQITSDGNAVQPAWSPDGTQLVYIRRNESVSDLQLLNLQSGEQQQLTFYEPDLPLGSLDRVYSSIWAFYPTWSPDGGEIAFASQYGPPYGSPGLEYRVGLFAMPPQPGADRSTLYIDQAGQAGRMAYTPDGTAILFGLNPDPPGMPQIYRYDRTTGAVDAIPGMPEQSYDPAVSPDTTLLACAARYAGGTDIVLLPLAGGTAVQLTTSGHARSPAFSPDGKHLAFLATSISEQGFDLWVLDLRPNPNGLPQPGELRRVTYDLAIDADSGISWGR